MHVVARHVVSGIATIAVAAGHALPSVAMETTRAEYEACQARDEQEFRAAIEAITTRSLQTGIANFDYAAAVAEEWRKAGLDEIVDRRVDLAVTEVREETSTADRLRSIVDSEMARRIAEKIAERTYRSDAMRAALEGLAIGVGKELGRHLELASHDAAGPAARCLQAFLGPRYGDAVARMVATGASKELALNPNKGEAGVGAGAVLRQSTEGITGAAILLVRRQLASMAQRVGQRIVGSVLSRLVSVVAGGVGVVLIAKDLWDLSGGVFPIIAAEMKSPATKEKVRAELAKSIAEQFAEHVKEIGVKSADRIVEIWREFRRAHAKVLDLAEQNAAFRSYLDALKPESLPRLDEAVALVLASEGEAAVLQRLQNGTLDEAVKKLPPEALAIARDTRSLETALRWNALAGADLPRVLDYELHQRAAPDVFTRTSLQRLVALADRVAVARLAGLDRSTRETLFELEPDALKSLARSLSEAELSTLAHYLTGLAKDPRERVLRAVAERPGRMQILASARVRDAILASRDQGAAVAMMLRERAGLLDPGALIGDLRLAWDGSVSPVLIWESHFVAVVALGALALVPLLMLRRLFYRGRSRGAAKPSAR